MALPQHKTTLSVLRSIIGIRSERSESEFATAIGRSTSWMKKASCGDIPLTSTVAKAIAYETGISSSWLLANDPTAPPTDRKGETYTLETYAEHRGLDNNVNADERYDFCLLRLEALMSEAKTKDRPGYFVFLLEDFIQGAQKQLKPEEPA
jgi:hypothetical protein